MILQWLIQLNKHNIRHLISFTIAENSYLKSSPRTYGR